MLNVRQNEVDQNQKYRTKEWIKRGQILLSHQLRQWELDTQSNKQYDFPKDKKDKIWRDATPIATKVGIEHQFVWR